MRPLFCAVIVLSSLVMAEAQSGAPIHNAGRAVKRTYHKAGHKMRATGHAVGHHYRATKHYFGHKARGVKKAIQN